MRKRLLAFMAGKQAFTRVDKHMPVKIACLDKGLGTLRTAVSLLTSMDSLVLTKVAQVRKLLLTYIA